MSDEDYMRSGAEAERRFDQLHRRATIESALRKLAGQSPHLLPFKDVQRRLGLRHAREIGARDIRLDKIVGSVGKPDAFTPSFFTAVCAPQRALETPVRCRPGLDRPSTD
jgi:hypothetical protein